MSPFKFKDNTHAEVTAYLKTRPFSEVNDLLPLIQGEATAEYNQDDVIKVLTYMVNRPYCEVFKVVNQMVAVGEEAPAALFTEETTETVPVVEETKA